MVVKRKLKDHRQYSRGYIDHEKARTDGLIKSNIRTILLEVKEGNT